MTVEADFVDPLDLRVTWVSAARADDEVRLKGGLKGACLGLHDLRERIREL